MTAGSGRDLPVLELVGITKRYGEVVACDRVDLSLHAGEIHGILGENGAGKSTLLSLMFGLVTPESGLVKIDGKPRIIADPMEAGRWGIGMVHQHYSLVDALTVWENVALGEAGRFEPDTTRDRIRRISTRYGLAVDPDAPVRDLPAGIRQRVEIIKCLSHNPRIILLDEPTSALTPYESEELFEVLAEGARSESWAVALVSHKLDEVLRATHRISVMRGGRVVEGMMTDATDVPSLARAMVGRPVSLRTVTTTRGARTFRSRRVDNEPNHSPANEPPMLRIAHASVRGADRGMLLNDLSVEVRSGEIVGVAGVEGNGQTAVADVLASLLPLGNGEVEVDGQHIPTGVAGAMAEAGVAVIPADRHRSGCVPEMTLSENLMIPLLDRMKRLGFLRRERIKRNAERLVKEYGIIAPGVDVPLDHLSGGNQQRVVIARTLAASPKVVVAHQPTRGLDVGAIEYVADRLRDAAREGIAILLLSTDLREISALADRVVVIHRGAIVGEMAGDGIDMSRLGLLMGGMGEPEGPS